MISSLLPKQLLKIRTITTDPIRLLGLSVSSPETNEKEGQIRPQWIEGLLPFEEKDLCYVIVLCYFLLTIKELTPLSPLSFKWGRDTAHIVC